MEPREKASAVYERLMDFLGMPEWHVLPAIDELVNTIISQNTNDKNRDIAFAELKRRFPTWEEVRDAPTEAVIDCIRYAGLGNQKAPRIQAVLREISAQNPNLDLDFLKQMPPAEARDWLTQFKGVGKKTASIVMLFSLGMPAFPVDTHIHRITGRLGLRPEKMSADDTHDLMMNLFSPEVYGPAHINIIRFGRLICDARRPKCAQCCLADLCEYHPNQ